MLKRLLLILRITLAWYLLALLVFVAVVSVFEVLGDFVATLGFAAVMLAMICAYSHQRRVRLLHAAVDGADALGNRHLRRIELPMSADAAFGLVEQVLRGFAPQACVDANAGSLRATALIRQAPGAWRQRLGKFDFLCWFVSLRNEVTATLAPAEGTSSLTLLCQPQGPVWTDWFRVDNGVNLDHAEAITRLIARRIADARRDERASNLETATQKELAIARLALLQAQVEPHFLYNTLASAQLLVRSDAAAADRMLGHLIDYLRHSLPSADATLSTLQDELDRARAYLEIMRVRMGARLAFQIDVPDDLLSVPLPSMVLQTLVENAIKHGLEPKPEGGTVWIFACPNDEQVAITVADDGLGFGNQPDQGGQGAGVGLANVRQRLQLTFGAQATLAVGANFPAGVAATLIVPADGPQP